MLRSVLGSFPSKILREEGNPSVFLTTLFDTLEVTTSINTSHTFMPPRWPRQPDRNDPAYRKLDDRMTFATHVALFAAVNSGLWFFRLAPQKIGGLATPGGLPETPWITVTWALLLVAHAVYVFAIAKYSDPVSPATTAGSGFGLKDKPTTKPKKS